MSSFDAPINFDEWVYVRGVGMPRWRVDQLEQSIGGKLVPDKEGRLLMILDSACYQVWKQNGGAHTPQRTLVLPGGERFVHRDLEMPIGGYQKTVYGPKKMWFRVPKIFVTGG